jgi:hypothetical protein
VDLMRRFKMTYKRTDLKDGVDYSIIYESEKAETPEQALQELKQNPQHKYYSAITHAEQIRVEALDD